MIAKPNTMARKQLRPDIVSGLDKMRNRPVGVCLFGDVGPDGAGSPELFTRSPTFIDNGVASTQLPVCVA